MAATNGGMIIVTAAYMIPEQARGRTIDKRTDVWAFGCVLYEILTGTRAFDGEDVTEIMAAIIRSEPNWGKLPTQIPPAIKKLLRRCLEKDRKERLPDIAIARIEINDAQTAPVSDTVVKSITLLTGWKRAVAVATVGLVGFVLGAAALTFWRPLRSAIPIVPIRLAAELGADPPLFRDVPAVLLSPDGGMLAFVVRGRGASQIYIRRLDQLRATPLEGTDGALSPFFSPDGQWIAFFAAGKLKKVSVTGGAAVAFRP
jgi:serine/threonine-protein kinase